MKFECYKDKKGEWRWRLCAKNKQIVATSGEGYVNRKDCLQEIQEIKENAPLAGVVVFETE